MTSASIIPDVTSIPRPSSQTHSDDDHPVRLRMRLKPKGLDHGLGGRWVVAALAGSGR